MYSAKLPKIINPSRLSQAGDSLYGHFATGKMDRLLPLVVSVDTEVNAQLHFRLDELNHPVASGELLVKVVLICQRCLQPFDFYIQTMVNWGFARNDDEAKQLLTRSEPVLMDHGRINLMDQIEDEIILNLPMIAMHTDRTLCVEIPGNTTGGMTKRKPLEGLANLNPGNLHKNK